jgi:DNA-directed RNA polymerase beta' subunit
MKLHLNVQYPFNEDFEFRSRITRLNLDQEMESDMAKDKGFLIKEPPPVDKALKRSDSIYSERFMKLIHDPDAFSDRYSCQCGATQSSSNRGMICPLCKTEVKYVGDDFEIFGWIKIKEPYAIIHPNLYKSIAYFIGVGNLENIIEPEVELDVNGMPVGRYDKRISKRKNKRKYNKRAGKVDETYTGIGMMEFRERFDEIMAYFLEKNKYNKKEYYDDIMENKDLIFIHSVPVYTTGLRPFKTEGKRFTFEGTNATFNIMAKLAAKINDDELMLYREKKYRNALLWDMQDKYNKLYAEIENICSSKKGSIRMLIGGRCSFTSRLVIVPDPKLRIDEIRLSYYSLVELLQQTIINILANSYNISYAKAYQIWYRSQLEQNPRVREIIENLIRANNGINVLVNRNPSINYGSIMALRCVSINDDYVMSLPLQILSPFAADLPKGWSRFIAI